MLASLGPMAGVAESTGPGTAAADAGHRGMRWQSLATLTTQVLQALVTLVVAAAVGPTEFALWGVAGVVLNAQWLIGNLGLGQALIYFRDEKRWRDAVDAAVVVSLGLGGLVVAITALAAPAIADVFGPGFDSSEVADVVRIFSLVFLFTVIAAVPQSLIERRLDFRRRAVPEIIAAIGYAAFAFVLLALGLGVWSLIVAKVVQSGVLMCAFWVVAPDRPRFPPRPRARTARELIGYGGVLTVGAVIGFLTGNLDTVAVGRGPGATALGAYVLAFTITQLAPTFLSMTLQRVYFPIYAGVRGDPALLRRAFAQGMRYLAIVMVPVTVGLLTIGPEALADAFGDEWRDTGPLIRVLALYGLFRGLSTSGGVLLAAVGRPGTTVWLQATALLVPAALLIPFHESAEEIAWIFAAGQALAFVESAIFARSYWSGAVGAVTRTPLIAAAAGAAAAYACLELVPGSVDGIAAAIAFVLVVAAVLVAIDPGVRTQLAGMAARLRRAPRSG